MRREIPQTALWVIALLLAGCLASPAISETDSVDLPGTPASVTAVVGIASVAVTAAPGGWGQTTADPLIDLDNGGDLAGLATEMNSRPAIVEATPTLFSQPAAIRNSQGYLSNQIARLNDHMPRAGSGIFAVPADAESAAFANLVAQLEEPRATVVAETAAIYDYEVVRYRDWGDRGAESFLLREMKPIQRGWGLYIFRIGRAREIIVEAPHPLFDRSTPAISLNLYRSLDARALLIAGAHRNASADGAADVAHNPTSIFQAIHETMVSANDPIVLQIHGFAANNHAEYPQVVLSGFQRNASGLIERLAEVMMDAGIRVGVCDGRAWRDLCGRSNAQAARAGNSIFVHVELDESIRRDPTPLIDAFARILR